MLKACAVAGLVLASAAMPVMAADSENYRCIIDVSPRGATEMFFNVTGAMNMTIANVDAVNAKYKVAVSGSDCQGVILRGDYQPNYEPR